jgi:hypothetical protein
MTKQTEWVQVGELAEGFAPDSNKLDLVDDLVGKTLTLYFQNDVCIKHSFDTNTQLSWTVLTGENAGNTATENYTVTSIREGIYFVDFVKDNQESVNIVLNFNTDNATVAITKLPSESEAARSAFSRVLAGDLLTGVEVNFMQASIDKDYSDDCGHPETDELVGKRVQYTYSPHEVYEHIYLNNNYYSWHCLKGVEKGLSDTDRCHYFKIAENLYFFVWREKIIPTVGVIMIDLDRLKTTGKIMGYDGTDFKKLNNFPVGAFAKPLNHTLHEFN